MFQTWNISRHTSLEIFDGDTKQIAGAANSVRKKFCSKFQLEITMKNQRIFWLPCFLLFFLAAETNTYSQTSVEIFDSEEKNIAGANSVRKNPVSTWNVTKYQRTTWLLYFCWCKTANFFPNWWFLLLFRQKQYAKLNTFFLKHLIQNFNLLVAKQKHRRMNNFMRKRFSCGRNEHMITNIVQNIWWRSKKYRRRKILCAK